MENSLLQETTLALCKLIELSLAAFQIGSGSSSLSLVLAEIVDTKHNISHFLAYSLNPLYLEN